MLARDLTIWRPTDGNWWNLTASSGYDASHASVAAWGRYGDVPLQGNFDLGSEQTLTVWRPSTGTFRRRAIPSGIETAIQWGIQDDIPSPADYDGDGIPDLAV